MKFILYTALALVMFASCKDKDEVITPVVGRDINTAEKVAVDRFSDAAGTLFKRSASSTLPAVNAPINLDVAPFITKGYGPMGTLTEYYNFDVHNTTPDDIYVFFKAGASTPISEQNNVIPTIPGDAGYNDFWVVNKVTVPDNYVGNSLTSEAEIIASGYPIAKTTTIVNCPVVPFGSTASKKFGGGSNAISIGWYKNKAVAYFSFEEKALTATSTGMVPVSPIYVMFNNNATGPASGFKTEANSDQTHNVLATLPSAASYSPLWSVQVVDNAAFTIVNNLATASAATILGANAALVNCPVVK
jgi:hypothetical protein